MGTLINSSFRPAWWLRSPHLQTLWPTWFRKRPALPLDWERVELADGDFIDLAWYRQADNGAPLVLMMHGLEGSLDSHYAPTLMLALYRAGFSVVFMHLRGRGREPNRLPRSYHSGATADLHEVLQQLARRGEMPAAALGVSLSGNLLLKYLGEQGGHTGLQAAVAVSIPFQLSACARKLEQGFSRIYGRYLLDKLKTSYREKFSRMASPLNVDVGALDTLYQFDEHITAPLNGFAGADDYYQRCSCAFALADIQVPTLVIHALDDPFMTAAIAPTPAGTSEAVTLELTPQGGHVGFVGGRWPWQAQWWLDERIPAYLAPLLRSAAR